MTTVAPPPPAPADRPPLPPLISLGIILAVCGGIIFVFPRPEAIKPEGWRMFAVFIGTVMAMMLRPISGGAAVLIGVVATVLLKTQTIAQALSGYGNSTVWLVISAFFIARSMINSGLARRLALMFVRAVGHTSVGLGYALVGSEMVMATVIPGNSARVGGILMPIARSLSEIYESRPGQTAALLGTYLMLTIYQGDVIACATYLTGQASNPIAADLAMKTANISVTWSSWLWAGIVPGLAAYFAMPWVVSKISPPQIRHTPQAADMARRELIAMGGLSRNEKIVLAVFVLVCGLWATASLHALATPTVALIGVATLLATGALPFSDLTREYQAWDVFVWYGGLIRMGEALNEFGVTTVFANWVGSFFVGWSWPVLLVVMALIYFYVHYVFASVTTHILSLYAPFLAVFLTAGAPPAMSVYLLLFFSNLCASLTHYGTTPAPIVFSAGYSTVGEWWKVGLVMSFVNIGIFGTIGLMWWKFIGLW